MSKQPKQDGNFFTYSCPTLGSGRHPFCDRRVRSRQATTLDPQSFAAAVTESTHFRSPRRRFVCSPHSPRPPDPFSHRSETFYPLEPPPGFQEPKVSPALLIPAQG